MPLLHTNPGETPLDDGSGLKIKGIQTREELDPHEARNILAASKKYYLGKVSRRKAPFDYAWSLRLHQEMFGKVWKWAGTLRTTRTTLGLSPEHIENCLYELFGNLPYWSDMPWIEQAARLHHQAVFIHPFPNGNGRWSHFLANSLATAQWPPLHPMA
jgi:fido (protein-threonine AMPylation protein)